MFLGSSYELGEDVEDVEDVEDEHQLSKKEIFGQIKKNRWNEKPGPTTMAGGKKITWRHIFRLILQKCRNCRHVVCQPLPDISDHTYIHTYTHIDKYLPQ